MKPFKLNSEGQHDLTTADLDEFDLATYDHEHAAAVYGANARSMSNELRKAWVRIEELEAALRVALGLYTNPDAETATGYEQYRMACAILERKP